MARTVIPLRRAPELVGTHLGRSSWHLVDQTRIDRFADATGDHQWIHVDPERAAAGPFGGTIAHGYLMLGMAPTLVAELIELEGVDTVINYGIRNARFLAPVLAGSWIRAGATVCSFRSRPRGFFELVVKVVMEVRPGRAKTCVVETVTLLHAAPDEHSEGDRAAVPRD